MPIFPEDLKPGEEVIECQEVVDPDDAVFDATTRPNLQQAVEMILGRQQGFVVPFASAAFDRHASLRDQNLFRCMFGRDSLLIADLLRFMRPELRLNVICALASVQGTQYDEQSEEEPGRIPHEVREPDDPVAQEISSASRWKFPYYGAVDATLIWLRCLAEEAQADSRVLELEIAGHTLAQRAARAAAWTLQRLGSPSGFVESTRSNPQGIENQVWKDSGDSYMHRDGMLARGDSTASVETVGETFDALMAASAIQAMAPRANWPVGREEFTRLAHELRVRLFERFWLGDHFALATERDAHGRQVMMDSTASNQGRLLDSAILEGAEFASYGRAITDVMMDPDMLSAAGLRTLAASHISYRPGGYHTGTSWPMDSTFVARGMVRHGFRREALEVATRTRHAIESVGGYPEFFRGDMPLHGPISTSIVDVRRTGTRMSVNRVTQPPQLLQGWTVAAYARLMHSEELLK
ncbi:MAG: amylo-alpha-1,6-glucosidase [Candidatus Nanopelagicales bacterium]